MFDDQLQFNLLSTGATEIEIALLPPGPTLTNSHRITGVQSKERRHDTKRGASFNPQGSSFIRVLHRSPTPQVVCRMSDVKNKGELKSGNRALGTSYVPYDNLINQLKFTLFWLRIASPGSSLHLWTGDFWLTKARLGVTNTVLPSLNSMSPRQFFDNR